MNDRCDVCGASARAVSHGVVQRRSLWVEYEHMSCTRCRRQWQHIVSSTPPPLQTLEDMWTA